MSSSAADHLLAAVRAFQGDFGMLGMESVDGGLHGFAGTVAADGEGSLLQALFVGGLLREHVLELLGLAGLVDGDAVLTQHVADDAGLELDVVGQRAESGDRIAEPGFVNVAANVAGIAENVADKAVQFPEQVPGHEGVAGRVSQIIGRDRGQRGEEVLGEVAADGMACGVLHGLVEVDAQGGFWHRQSRLASPWAVWPSVASVKSRLRIMVSQTLPASTRA